MPNYVLTYGYPRFYPDVRDAEGKSLMAMPGVPVELDAPPDDGWWVLAEQAPADPPADGPPAGPEPAQDAPVEVPVPVDPPPAPEPAPAPVAPAEPVPAPESVQPAMTADWFAGLANPPARA